MKTIKFVSSDIKQKTFASALRKNMNNYFKEKGISKKGNLSMFLQSLAMLSIYIIPFILILTLPLNPWIALLMAILMGIGLAGIGMAVMHDAVHG